ncbi:MAG: zinc-ribbon domain-containing protein [Paracoccaceae bacterium]
MRLICPNCGAQYEVGETVIPDGGRDVQCSNCGHTWFQRQDQSETDQQTETAAVTDKEIHAEIAEGEQQNDSTQPDQPDTTPVSEPAKVAAPVSAPEAAPEPAAAPSAGKPQRQKLDGDIATILREEAETESALRAPPTPPLETQPDLGLQQARKHTESGFHERSTSLHQNDQATDGADKNRMDLLPDIEEINSTLVATSENPEVQGDDSPLEIKRRTGFRRGFLIAVIGFLILALLYVFAATVIQTIPSLTTPMAAFVDWVNSIRAAIDGMMLGVVDRLSGVLSQLGADKSV